MSTLTNALVTIVSLMLIAAPVLVLLVLMGLGWRDALKAYGALALLVVWAVGILALMELVL